MSVSPVSAHQQQQIIQSTVGEDLSMLFSNIQALCMLSKELFFLNAIFVRKKNIHFPDDFRFSSRCVPITMSTSIRHSNGFEFSFDRIFCCIPSQLYILIVNEKRSIVFSPDLECILHLEIIVPVFRSILSDFSVHSE